jgi:hypothetical protein
MHEHSIHRVIECSSSMSTAKTLRCPTNVFQFDVFRPHCGSPSPVLLLSQREVANAAPQQSHIPSITMTAEQHFSTGVTRMDSPISMHLSPPCAPLEPFRRFHTAPQWQ